MTENQTKKIAKRIFYGEFPKSNLRFINLAGNRYQERGLPDWMILVDRPALRFWLEIKRSWRDTPSGLQQHNIIAFRRFGFITGFLVGDEFKLNWTDNEITSLEEFLKSIKSQGENHD